GREHNEPPPGCHLLARDIASLEQPVGGAEREVDSDLHHSPAWASRNWVSSGTGRPVAPLSLPLFHAVPAMSRWAQRYCLVKRERKHAAVTEPAGGPPMLAISAKPDLSCGWYSSSSGMRQVGSTAERDAARSCSASSLSCENRPVLTWPRATTQAPVSVAMSITAAVLKRSA